MGECQGKTPCSVWIPERKGQPRDTHSGQKPAGQQKIFLTNLREGLEDKGWKLSESRVTGQVET